MKNKAFSLIELLVTIAIISLLSSIIFASLSSARQKAEVAKANSELKEIEKAVEITRLSNSNSSLPVQTDITKSFNETTATTDPAYVALSEVLPSIPETGSIINGGSEADKNYIYISDGDSATDSSGTDYYCKGKLNEYTVLYKVIDDSFSLYRYVGIDGLFDEFGNTIASKMARAQPILHGDMVFYQNVVTYLSGDYGDIERVFSYEAYPNTSLGYYACK